MNNNRLYVIIGVFLIVVVIGVVIIFTFMIKEKKIIPSSTELTPEEIIKLPGYVQDSKTGEVFLDTDIPKEVILIMDKKQYKVNDKMKISITNNLDKEFTILGGSGCCSQLFMIEKIEKGKTKKIINYAGSCGEMVKDTVLVGQEKVFEFTPKVYNESCGVSNLIPGRYRIYIRTDYPDVNKVFSNMITIE